MNNFIFIRPKTSLCTTDTITILGPDIVALGVATCEWLTIWPFFLIETLFKKTHNNKNLEKIIAPEQFVNPIIHLTMFI